MGQDRVAADRYVYVVFRKNGTPCYVGKGHGSRYQHHVLGRSHNIVLKRIVKKEGELPVIKIREGLTDDRAFALEIALISAIGRYDLGNGPLVNMTAGGDGVVGHEQTPEQIEKLRATRIGRRLSPESRAKVSAGLKGKPKSVEHCAAVSMARKGIATNPWSAESKLKASQSQRARRAAEGCKPSRR